MSPEVMQILCYFLILIVGIVLGSFIDTALVYPNGELVIDTSDPEKDKWLIRLSEPTERAAKRHIVILKVSHRTIEEEDKWPYEK